MPLDKTLSDTLRAKLRGGLLLPGDSGYDDARSIWNAMIDRKPAAIVRALGVADVVATVGFARDQGVQLSIRGGGHNIAGLALCDDGIVLDLSQMRGVFVDPSARSARAQAGCLLGDVDRETQLHGMAAVLGFVSNTGIAGLTLGGGFGYLTRRFGWTCDNLNAIEAVTADGRIVRASERENPDLFWGMRGGGGNFAVATSFDYRLYPVGPEIVGGAIAWAGDDIAPLMEYHRKLSAEVPPECTLVAALRLAPPAPWLPKEIHGKPIAAVFVCDTGPVAEAEARLKPLKAFRRSAGDICQRRSYVSQQSLIDATQPKGRRYYWKSEYLSEITPEFLAAYLDHFSRIPSPHTAMALFPLGGALNRQPADHCPMGNRDAKWVFNLTSAWDKPEDDARNIEWTRAAWNDLKRFSTGGTYINFLTEEEGDERVRAAYGANHARLADVKTTWDPANLFRANKNIAPTKV
ncbi:MAG TPA: FAD-binding oxidoreductase [Gemmatimonadales bacterium]|jgi:FAD/FMN-containing dehydrogenase